MSNGKIVPNKEIYQIAKRTHKRRTREAASYLTGQMFNVLWAGHSYYRNPITEKKSEFKKELASLMEKYSKEMDELYKQDAKNSNLTRQQDDGKIKFKARKK